MNLSKAYVEVLCKILSRLGVLFLLASAISGSFLACYLCLTAIMVAFAGPIAVSLNKKKT